MNAKRKESALKTYADTPIEELEISLQADEKGYTPEEIAEIIAAKEASEGKPKEEVKATPSKPAAKAMKNGFVYPLYDLWEVTAKPNNMDKEGGAKTYDFRAISIVRPNVKLEHSAAEAINSQSHNSLRRYYPAGTVKNGDVEAGVAIK